MDVELRLNSEVVNVIVVDSLEQAQAAFPEYECVERSAQAPPAPPPAAISKLQFMLRFTTTQRVAAREHAKTDPVLFDALALLDLSDEIRTDNPLTVQMVGYLAVIGIIDAADIPAILA